ncbi:MAG: saccharopine dehydrogenase family protein [bacterium]
MSKVLIIGAGGVGGVVTHKCAQMADVFEDICLASRTESKCKAIASQLKRKIQTARVDADNPLEVVRLIKKFNPDVLINVALPYQDLAIMEACLATGVDYLDTANYEPPNKAKFEYKWQWKYHKAFREKGLLAVLGCGFDPGVSNIFCAYAKKHYFDEIHTVDILDCNAGSHGKAFATNFNPEINIREITARGKYWEKGQWKETDPLSVHQTFNFPEVGPKEMYLMYHEELESLVKNIQGLKRIRFWMTFGEQYLTHLRVLENVGMTGIAPVMYEGRPVVPLKFLKAILPEPSSLGANYTGKTNIGCMIEGIKDGKKRKLYIYNVCDHAECWKEVKAQAISYTTGVPAVIGARLMVTGAWCDAGVFNVEQFNPDPFMEELTLRGLPWKIKSLRPGQMTVK